MIAGNRRWIPIEQLQCTVQDSVVFGKLMSEVSRHHWCSVLMDASRHRHSEHIQVISGFFGQGVNSRFCEL